MAAGRQPGRCPNVGGALRAAIEREAGARCPHATSWLCGSYRTVGSLGTRSTAHRNLWSCRAVTSKRRVGSDLSDRSDGMCAGQLFTAEDGGLQGVLPRGTAGPGRRVSL
jgi:hypothetical protein